MRIIEVTDINGRKRKVDLDALDAKEFAKPGETYSFSMMAMDADGGLFVCDADQIKGHNTMTDDTQKLTDADRAYKEMCDALDWRSRTPAGVAGESADSAHARAARDLQDAWRRG